MNEFDMSKMAIEFAEFTESLPGAHRVNMGAAKGTSLVVTQPRMRVCVSLWPACALEVGSR